MNRAFLILIVWWSFLGLVGAQNVEILDYGFPDPEQGYVELHFLIPSPSLIWNSDSTATHETSSLCFFVDFDLGADRVKNYAFQMDFERVKGDSATLVYHDVRRYPLDPGDYSYTIKIGNRRPSGLIDTLEGLSLQKEILLEATDDYSMSTPILLQDMRRDQESMIAKNGFVLQPLSQDILSGDMQRLVSYVEVYSVLKTESEASHVQYSLWRGDSTFVKKASRKLRNKSRDLMTLQLPVDDLDPGEYQFVVELMDSTNKVLEEKRSSFYKESVATSERYFLNMDEIFVGGLTDEEVDYALRALMPRISIDNYDDFWSVVKSDKTKEKKILLYGFWREVNPQDPETAYLRYMDLVEKVDQRFGEGAIEGYATARGTVFLKYGPPSDIFTNEIEISAPPYEIWVYNDFPATAQVGVKFLFYNPSLEGQIYLLLHSTALNERKNLQWQRVLYDLVPQEVEGVNHADATDVADGYLRLAKDMFDDF